MISRIATVVCVLFACQSAGAALVVGLLDDFEDGTLGGWSPPAGNTTNVPGGPVGSTRALEIRPAQRLSAFDAGINGIIDSGVNAIEIDMLRPAGTTPLDIRLVLFGPGGGNRWTSSAAQLLPSDGSWNTYSFSILPGDLTQVLGVGTYADLTNNLNRIMFRYDAGGPSPGGTPVAPTDAPFFIDNVTATPEPATLCLLAIGSLAVLRRRRSA